MEVTRIAAVIVRIGRWFHCLLRPARSVSELAVGVAMDLTRSRSALLAENAMLRQQVIVLRRSIGRPRPHRDERVLLVLLARLTRRWREALHVVRPETLLRSSCPFKPSSNLSLQARGSYSASPAVRGC